MTSKQAAKITIVSAAILAVLCGGLYGLVVWEGSTTRAEAPVIEVSVARWLLRHTVPSDLRATKNPLDAAAGSPDVFAGQEAYRDKCELCHGYDGSGKTTIGSGQYPRPPDLRSPAVQGMSDGQIFYHVKNGIRHTGMPAWELPDRQLWQLTAYLRNLPKVAAAPLPTSAQPSTAVSSAHYVGSAACKDCHAEIYNRWKDTRMAKVVQDPREHPEAIIPDLSKPDPLLTFTKDDIAFTYGSKWKQRYFKKVGDDYFPFPAQWDVTHKVWRQYFVRDNTDWWTPFYPPDNFQRPTGPLCDGCHSVNYDVATKTPTEWNVGCEKCHGPGSDHVETQGRPNIVNPAKLDYVQANDVCIQCHSQGQPLANPIEGRYYDWPVGFHLGKKLSEFWKLEEHKLGETTFTHFADGTAHKNRMQGNDYVQSLMYTRGVTCSNCHDAHGTTNDAMLWKPVESICLSCHGPNSQNGPRAPTIEAHTHHQAGSAGNECVGCHMPKIEQTIGDVNVRAHTFRFITPAASDAMKIPNACNVCHTDKTTSWTADILKTWNDHAPWRMAQ